jgi:MFS family permease
MSSADYPPRPYAWTVVAILIATAVLSYTDRQVLSLLVDPIRGSLAISDTQISLLLGTAFAVIYGIAGIPLGFLADRISRRNLIFAGVCVWSLGTIACGLSHDFREMFASRIIVGLGESALSPAAISLISDYFPPSRRGTAVGLYLCGIALGYGASILIGGAVLHLIEAGALATTALAIQAPWRTVLVLIGAPGLLWAFAILLIREPARHVESAVEPGALDAWAGAAWTRVLPIYLVLAAASFVDSAVGAWAPTLLIRNFAKDPAQIGVELGVLLTVGFGGGVLLGGFLADRAGVTGGLRRKLYLCLSSVVLILPVSFSMNSSAFVPVLYGVPLYFALSGMVSAIGTSAILDIVPNRTLGLVLSVSFFLNVAIGAGLGPTAVALAGAQLFGAKLGLGPPLVLTAISGCLVSVVALATMLAALRPRQSRVT